MPTDCVPCNAWLFKDPSYSLECLCIESSFVEKKSCTAIFSSQYGGGMFLLVAREDLL